MLTADLTFILAHGAWADGSSWSKVITRLLHRDIKAVMAPLPLTSLADDVAAVERIVEWVGGPGVLVGHAYAGIGRRAGCAGSRAATQSPACITVPVARPLWKDVPSWYLVAEHDRMIVEDTQRFMARRMNAKLVAHPVDHVPSVTAPDAVVDLFLQAAQGIAG
ncbi:alpha/beta fold hydrolase [Luteibacter sp.]|jgi:pimeloyl-ACP methyl ester carboxylesterase|uniref:alpha/beta fold hydrolase n=1 Tax=Luteibacter sp. TaxID=1886636 RepID=UPI002F406C44